MPRRGVWITRRAWSANATGWEDGATQHSPPRALSREVVFGRDRSGPRHPASSHPRAGPDLHRGVRAPAGVVFSFARGCATLSLVLPSCSAFSHVTAARLHDLPLPLALENDDFFDVIVPRGVRAPRRKRVRGHQSALGEKDVDKRTKVRATTPERTFCDLATMLTLGQLVAVGDELLARGGTPARKRLETAVRQHPSRRHRRVLRRALDLLDRRAESPKESELRVLLIEAGFPAPAVNHVVRTTDESFVARVDLAYPQLKIAIEYEGDHHRENKDQWRKDLKRRRRLEALGWLYLAVTQADLDDPTDLIADLRAAVARRS